MKRGSTDGPTRREALGLIGNILTYRPGVHITELIREIEGPIGGRLDDRRLLASLRALWDQVDLAEWRTS